MGNEVLEYGVDAARPGMNIHRNPLCGRTRILSEDPVVAGLTAAAMVNGVQSMGVGTSIKQLCREQSETNRLKWTRWCRNGHELPEAV